jgi:hypothetical protein
MLERATTIFGALSIVGEKDENGETIVEIQSDKLKHILLTFRDKFIKSYELLLGFEVFYKRLSKVYDMDLSYRVSAWAKEINDLVESYNKTLSDALKPQLPYTPDKKKRYKDDELFINTTKITPNTERVDPAIKDLSELLGDAF